MITTDDAIHSRPAKKDGNRCYIGVGGKERKSGGVVAVKLFITRVGNQLSQI
jgi:hypothetical protein